MNLIMNWKKMKMNNYQKFILLLQNYLKENLAISDDDIQRYSIKFLSDMKMLHWMIVIIIICIMEIKN